MNNSIFLVGILMVIGVSCDSGHMPEQMLKIFTSCTKELNISEDEYKEAMEKYDFSNPKLHCMPECIMRGNGIMTDKEVNVENLKKIIRDMHGDVPDEEVESSNKKCLGEAKAEEDNCKFALAYEKCILNAFGIEQK